MYVYIYIIIYIYIHTHILILIVMIMNNNDNDNNKTNNDDNRLASSPFPETGRRLLTGEHIVRDIDSLHDLRGGILRRLPINPN